MKGETMAADRTALLDDYVTIAKLSGWAIEATALRTESIDLRQVLAHAATDGRMTFEALAAAVAGGEAPDVEPTWAARLARVAALQGFLPTDRSFAVDLLGLIAPSLGTDVQRFRRLRVELLIEAGRFAEAQAALDADPDLRSLYGDYYSTDLLNPFLPAPGSPFADAPRWLEAFAAIFRGHGLEPVGLRDGDGPPFDRLSATAASTVDGGPLVSVLMTTYRPEPAPLRAAVESVLAQSWTNLELLLLDDASPDEHVPVLEEIADLDPRIRLIRLPENGGTYRARNAGLRAAAGEFVTNHDDDDWSHPRRIERQVDPLLQQPELPATRAAAVTADEALVRSRPGYNPVAPHAATLMFRAEQARALGGYLSARRAADNELHHRLETVAGVKALDLDVPLVVYRIRADSLSRGDFRAGWAHPARRAFRDAYRHWHAGASTDELVIDPAGTPPVPVPTRFAVSPGPAAEYDVVYVSDWRGGGGLQRAGLDEVRAMIAAGMRVGVAHLEAARFMSGSTGRVCAPLQALVNAGRVTQVLPDDRVHARLVIIGYPPVVQFAPAFAFGWEVDEVVVLANQLPSDVEGLDHRYRVEDCARNVARLLGRRPLWMPQGPVIREGLRRSVLASELSPQDLPAAIDVDAWATQRRHIRSDRPVIGRHGGDGRYKWPKSPRVLREVYPVDGSVDVRLLGDASSATKRLGLTRPPASWVVFAPGDLPVRAFLNSLDFHVSYLDSRVSAPLVRPVLEAAAAGAVVILPPQLEGTFGDVAHYAPPEEVGRLVAESYADPRTYRAMSAGGRDAVTAHHSHARYVAAVATVLHGGARPTAPTPRSTVHA
jgi:hypothetical protein